MPVISDATLQRYSAHGGTMRGLATPSLGAQQIMVWRGSMAPGGASTPEVHDQEEVVVILGGRGEAVIDGIVSQFGPNDVVLIPRQTLHQVINRGTEPLEAIVVLPGGTRTFTPTGDEKELPTWAN